MTRLRTIHRCTDCGVATPRWVGRCPACGAWNSLVEDVEEVGPSTALARRGTASGPVEGAAPITEVDATGGMARPTGVDELDRVLGGGLVAGSVTLLGGEPGIGKSTLLLEVCGRAAGLGRRVLYVSGEESRQQVRSRAERVGAVHPELWLASEVSLPRIITLIDQVHPELLVIDSIQTLHDPELDSAPGSLVQVRECANGLVRAAKQRGLPVVLVGHVTKDGGLAGPRVLEHVVDTVLSFEGERHHALRMLRATKHRFGPTNELGLFEMAEVGLVGVPDAGLLFLSDRRPGVPGSAVAATVEGQRPLLVEVQALVAPSELANPRRAAQGLDPGRLAMLLAVLERRAGLSFAKADVYVSAAGGVRLSEPGTDLAVCLALASALTDRPLPEGLVACGEVGLGSELRQVAQTPRRLAEAARLGFTHAVVPASASGFTGMEVVRAATVLVPLLGLGLLNG